MEKVDELLQVGDVIYQCGNYGIIARMTIDRVTNTRAYAGDLEFKRVYTGERIEKGKGHKSDMGLRSYYIETEDRRRAFLLKDRLNFVRNFTSYSKVSDDDIFNIYDILIKYAPTI